MQLFHSAPTRPRLVEAKSNSSEEGGSEELDFIALLSVIGKTALFIMVTRDTDSLNE